MALEGALLSETIQTQKDDIPHSHFIHGIRSSRSHRNAGSSGCQGLSGANSAAMLAKGRKFPSCSVGAGWPVASMLTDVHDPVSWA